MSAHPCTSVLLVGVGGQGVVLAAEVLARAAIATGLDAKKSEVHGLAMRGGAVQSHVRFGAKIHSPLAAPGMVDILLGFEELEALRHASMLKSGGIAIVNARRLYPAPVASGREVYPEGVVESLRLAGLAVVPVKAEDLAAKAGKGRSENFVLLGVLSRFVALPPAAWQAALSGALPRNPGDVNLRAFALGLKHAEEMSLEGEPAPPALATTGDSLPRP